MNANVNARKVRIHHVDYSHSIYATCGRLAALTRRSPWIEHVTCKVCLKRVALR